METFIKMVKENFGYYTNLNMDNYIISVGKVQKPNVTLTAFSLSYKDDTSVIVPQIYLDKFYEQYTHGKRFDLIIKELVEEYENAFELSRNKQDVDIDKSKTFIEVINKEKNRELLENVVSRDYLDLAIIYRIMVDVDENGIESIVVTDELAESLEMSEEDLYEIGIKNTKEMMGIGVNSLMRSLLDGKNIIDIDSEELSELKDEEMLLVTNKYFVYGASAIVYKDVFKRIADMLEDDVNIIPSSIHEILVIRSGDVDSGDLPSLVKEVNDSSVAEKDILSYNVYHYNRKTDEITIIENNDN